MNDQPEMPKVVARQRRDVSFRSEAAFASHAWAAARLGMSPDTFRRKRALLVRAGFPEPHPILNRYHKADVEDWIDGHRRVRNTDPDEGEVNWAAL